jgi:hypothetical protein
MQVQVQAPILVGTTDNQPFVFKVNQLRAGFSGSASNINVSFGFYTLDGGNSYDNSAFGAYALSNNNGIGNSAFGLDALRYNTTGSWNVAIGYNSLRNNSTGSTNVAVGPDALYSNTSGVCNVGIGRKAINANQTGNNNTAVGQDALLYNTGSNNVAIGYNALGRMNYNCSSITALGANTDLGNTSDLYNATVIGYGAYTNINNVVALGNIYVVRIGGYVEWTKFSDRRIKKNIRPDVPGLEFIQKLQPVTYTMDLDAVDKIQRTNIPPRDESDYDPALALIDKKAREAKEKIVYTGFIAQDVEKAAQSIGYDFSGVDAAQNENDLYGLRYSEFVVPLVKAVQELSEQNASLQNQVEKLTELVNLLLDREGTEPFPDTRSSSVPNASLEQNYPNPFSSSTTIAYTLPQTFRSAKIVITSLSGQVFNQIPVSGAGTGSIMIAAGSLSAGTYSSFFICG